LVEAARGQQEVDIERCPRQRRQQISLGLVGQTSGNVDVHQGDSGSLAAGLGLVRQVVVDDGFFKAAHGHAQIAQVQQGRCVFIVRLDRPQEPLDRFVPIGLLEPGDTHAVHRHVMAGVHVERLLKRLSGRRGPLQNQVHIAQIGPGIRMVRNLAQALFQGPLCLGEVPTLQRIFSVAEQRVRVVLSDGHSAPQSQPQQS
jgi:hypothetical protein